MILEGIEKAHLRLIRDLVEGYKASTHLEFEQRWCQEILDAIAGAETK